MGNSDTLSFVTTRSYAAESPEEAATIEAGLRGDWPEAKIFLERLVRANSHTLNLEGVEANAGMLARAFAPLGFLHGTPARNVFPRIFPRPCSRNFRTGRWPAS